MAFHSNIIRPPKPRISAPTFGSTASPAGEITWRYDLAVSSSSSPQHLEPPYYAVIITTQLHGEETADYRDMAARMAELGTRQPGYLGRQGMSDGQGRDLSIIYYRDHESIHAWKADLEHLEAQRLGKERWYQSYTVEVARVEREYSFTRGEVHDASTRR
ncbi:antibiotic biosynthesis monooxygenase family protein [Nocardia sp. NPDC051570]|uniref:antibiotic biosynthesis monooxygenase family protein n=1 Tax=Nocardia sp. NPDC051570 TaxID=3364324 RepID=UPI003798C13E